MNEQSEGGARLAAVVAQAHSDAARITERTRAVEAELVDRARQRRSEADSAPVEPVQLDEDDDFFDDEFFEVQVFEGNQ